MFGIFKRKELVPVQVQQQIVEAIKKAEQQTSGEIRVFIESRCAYINAADRASELFFKLKMDNTTYKNAVLVYIALTDRQMALFGDEGIYKKTGGDPYWKKELDLLRGFLQQGKLAEGVCRCIADIGAALSLHFPYDGSTDKNELPDDIVFGN